MLKNKLTLVTGGGGGIGRAICDKFAREGGTVVVVDVNKQLAEESLASFTGTGNVKHSSIQCDITNRGFVDQLLAFCLDKYQRPPAVVVNCAGVTMDKSIHKMTEEQWDWVNTVNLKGPFLMTQVFSKAMIEAGPGVPGSESGGSIVNVSSIIAKTGNFGQANYAASKAGLIGLTKTVARELARHTIRCNAVLPGFIETPMTDKIPQPLQEVAKQLTPLGRFGTPDEVAGACVFLASDLSSYVTGACIEVTGGFGM